MGQSRAVCYRRDAWVWGARLAHRPHRRRPRCRATGVRKIVRQPRKPLMKTSVALGRGVEFRRCVANSDRYMSWQDKVRDHRMKASLARRVPSVGGKGVRGRPHCDLPPACGGIAGGRVCLLWG